MSLKYYKFFNPQNFNALDCAQYFPQSHTRIMIIIILNRSVLILYSREKGALYHRTLDVLTNFTSRQVYNAIYHIGRV